MIKILVIDQSYENYFINEKYDNDLIKSTKTKFIEMINTALHNHPEDLIYVKVDCLNHDREESFLMSLPFNCERIRYISISDDKYFYFCSISNLYTVSSSIGFHALLCDINVHCFGEPFYWGWGLTKDNNSSSGASKTIECLFFKYYINENIYVDPITNKNCSLDNLIDFYSDFYRPSKNVNSVNIDEISFVKKRLIKRFFKSWNVLENSMSTRKLLWGKVNNHIYDSEIRIEDGFIRSVGLGVLLSKPVSLVCDFTGIYFDASKASDLENMLNFYDISDWELNRSKKLINKIINSDITKYNVGTDVNLELPSDKKIILVIGQVESDASIIYGSSKFKKNCQILDYVRKKRPNDFLIFKPHPDVVIGERDKGKTISSIASADLVVNDISISALFDVVTEVHTLTSLAGFEALLRGVKVFTYGMPFYAGWGLTVDFLECQRRKRIRSLAELAYCAIILYPTYIDPISNKKCSVDQIIYRFIDLKNGKPRKTILTSILLLVRKIRNFLKNYD